MKALAALAFWATAPGLLAADAGSLNLTLPEATRRALEHNTTLAVERENLEQAGFGILGARGAYDTLWSADLGWRRHTDPINSAFSGAPPGRLAPEIESGTASTSLSQLLPTGGSVSLLTGWERDRTNGAFTILSPAYSTNIVASVRQPLLRDLSIDPAREAIRVASANP